MAQMKLPNRPFEAMPTSIPNGSETDGEGTKRQVLVIVALGFVKSAASTFLFALSRCFLYWWTKPTRCARAHGDGLSFSAIISAVPESTTPIPASNQIDSGQQLLSGWTPSQHMVITRCCCDTLL
ncbi:hypothetical protein GGI25_005656 [Coemansia spiralis]|uniref:Uncharacterized protein n=2 Tax=Coemansia TaxID=4863 RepID=A0A9W8KW18_9FUNG|nr:hypothetical protein EDC05_005707 [Coemansia umbellata]KAJ2618745.1 hypothetical protein GGI26_006375 [Coemansia sp. RSA 1358]KAJ2671007.1 hypothetical protein GGI25_005656 [Coemansia spiralis]